MICLRVKPVFHGAYFEAVSAPTLYAPYPRRVALSSPEALPGEDKARTKSAPKPLQNTLHGKRALDSPVNYNFVLHKESCIMHILCQLLSDMVGSTVTI